MQCLPYFAMLLLFSILDQSGKVRIWDTINKEHILKNEFHVLGGPIKDIAWDSESKRLAVAGEGKQR